MLLAHGNAMLHPPDASTPQERYGLVLDESPQRPGDLSSAAALPPRGRIRSLVGDGLALTYMTAIGWIAFRAAHWLIVG